MPPSTKSRKWTPAMINRPTAICCRSLPLISVRGNHRAPITGHYDMRIGTGPHGVTKPFVCPRWHCMNSSWTALDFHPAGVVLLNTNTHVASLPPVCRLWLCTFTLSVAVCAVLLLPISILSNEVLLSFPQSYYMQWLNGSLIHGTAQGFISDFHFS